MSKVCTIVAGVSPAAAVARGRGFGPAFALEDARRTNMEPIALELERAAFELDREALLSTGRRRERIERVRALIHEALDELVPELLLEEEHGRVSRASTSDFPVKGR